jgi:hypothetical protein
VIYAVLGRELNHPESKRPILPFHFCETDEVILGAKPDSLPQPIRNGLVERLLFPGGPLDPKLMRVNGEMYALMFADGLKKIPDRDVERRGHERIFHVYPTSPTATGVTGMNLS